MEGLRNLCEWGVCSVWVLIECSQTLAGTPADCASSHHPVLVSLPFKRRDGKFRTQPSFPQEIWRSTHQPPRFSSLPTTQHILPRQREGPNAFPFQCRVSNADDEGIRPLNAEPRNDPKGPATPQLTTPPYTNDGMGRNRAYSNFSIFIWLWTEQLRST